MINKANLHSVSLILEYIWYNPNCKMEELIKNNVRSKNTLKRYLYGQKYGYSDTESLIEQGIIIAHSTTMKKNRKSGKNRSYPDGFEVNQDWLLSNIDKFPRIKKIIRFGNEDFGYYFYTIREAEKKIEEDKEYREMDAVFQIYERIFAHSTSHKIIQDPNSKTFYFSDEQRIVKSWLIHGLLLISFAYNPDLWNSIEKGEDFNIEMSIKLNIPIEYRTDLFKAFQTIRDFCINKKKIPYIPDFPLNKGIAHIKRMNKGLLKKNPFKTLKEGRKTIPFHNDLDAFDAIAYKQHRTNEEDKARKKIKIEKDFKEFMNVLKESEPFYLGSQELKTIDSQLKKIKKKK